MSGAKALKLSEFCTTGSGGTPSRAKMERFYKGGTIPWIKSGELRESVINGAEEHVTEAALKESSIKMVPAGAILLAMYGATVGRLGILGIEATTNQAVCHIIPDPKIAETRYVYHALSSQVPSLISMGVGGAQPNINQGIIKSLVIPLPCKPEQQRIAAILDQADALRAIRREALAQLDSLTHSIFIEMFGDFRTDQSRWQIVKFDGIVKDSRIGLVRGSQELGQENPYRYLRMNAIARDGTLHLDGALRAKATPEELDLYQLRQGDLLFNTRNSRELVGKTALFRSDELYLFNNNLLRVRFVEGVEPEYVFAAFKTRLIQNELEIRKSGTTNVFAVYYKDLRTLPVPVPPHSLQKTFTERIQSIEAIKKTHRAAVQELDRLFASLQHRAFQGEL